MIQELLTYLIVATAFITAAYKIVHPFLPVRKKKHDFMHVEFKGAHGCPGCSETCALKKA